MNNHQSFKYPHNNRDGKSLNPFLANINKKLSIFGFHISIGYVDYETIRSASIRDKNGKKAYEIPENMLSNIKQAVDDFITNYNKVD